MEGAASAAPKRRGRPPGSRNSNYNQNYNKKAAAQAATEAAVVAQHTGTAPSPLSSSATGGAPPVPVPELGFKWGEMDLTRLNRKVIMLKVPKYMALEWDHFGPNQEIGRMRLPRWVLESGGAEPVDPQSRKRKREEDDRKLRDPRISGGTFNTSTSPVLSKFQKDHTLSMMGVNSAFCWSESDKGQFVCEGQVFSQISCAPNVNDRAYRDALQVRSNVKKTTERPAQLTEDSVPAQRTVKQPALKKVRKADTVQDKMIRMGRTELLNSLFDCFQRQERWTLKSLREHTQQPAVWLKEMLTEVCVYNKKGPNKNTFEIKPEYKKTKREDTTTTTTTTTPASTLPK